MKDLEALFLEPLRKYAGRGQMHVGEVSDLKAPCCDMHKKTLQERDSRASDHGGFGPPSRGVTGKARSPELERSERAQLPP